MKITEAIKAELTQWLDTFWKTYINGDYDHWATFVADDYYNIGGTKEEIWHSKQEILEYSYAMQDQMVGQAEFRNRTIEVLPYRDYLMVNEFTDLYVKIEGEWTFYGPFRMSSLMSKTDTGWIALHQHGSYPDMKATEGEAFAADALKAENKRLQAAVDQRTSELQGKNQELAIETALEKVRAVAMGMKTPDDMLQVCRIIAEQLEAFGVGQIRNLQTALIESKEEIYLCYQYFPSYDRDIIERTEYRKSPVEQQMVDQMLAARDSHFLGALTGKELADFRTHRKREKHLDDPLLDKSEELGYCFLSIGEGGLGITLYRSLDEQSLALFKRFHQVFSLAYQRFRDIQKAEKQARESEIELALERVRARTMAMHSSSELEEASILLDEQVRSLGIQTWGCAFHIYAEDEAGDYEWFSSANGSLPFYKTPREQFFLDFYERGQQGEKFYVKEFAEGECKAHYDYLKTIPVMGDSLKALKESGIALPTYQIDHIAFFNHGYILFITYEPVPEAYAIFQRFAKVFEQTYTRFLDLQKAEAQAREAQIEAALEKVRSRSLAMHNSKELNEVVKVLFEKLNELQIPSTAVAIQTFTDDSKDMDVFVCGDVGTGLVINQYHLPYFDHPIINDYIRAHEESLAFYKGEYSVAEKDSFYDVVLKLPELTNLPSEVERMIRKSSHYSVTMAPSGKSIVAVNDFVGKPLSEPDIAILKRFSKVFDQAYTRFLDLQKAEAQAKEAQIEAALEKVRSRSLAMTKSDQLSEVILEIHRKFNELEVSMESRIAIVVVLDSVSKDFNQYIASQDVGNIYISTPYFQHPILDDFYEAKEAGVQFFSKAYSEEEKNSYFKRFFETSFTSAEIAGLEEQAKWVFAQKFYTHSQAFQKNSCIGMADYSGVPLTEYEIDIIKRFSKVFDQAYTRFLDLKRAEAQTREAQIEAALERVRAQTMAMHSSDDVGKCVVKMFSELTALGVDEGTRFGIGILNHENENNQLWTARKTGEDVNMHIGNIDMAWHPMLQKARQAWLEQVPFHKYVLEGEDLPDYYRMLNNAPDYKIQIPIEKLPEREIQHCFIFEHGFFYAFSPREFQPELIHITQRFSALFEQTYRRYLDLVRAEAQAREAQIEAALERIRGQVASMRESTELLEIVVTMRSEFVALGHEAHYFWHMRWLPDSYEKAMTSGDGTQIGMVMSLPRRIHGDIKLVADWEKGSEPILVLAMETETAVDYVEKMINWGDFERVDPQAPTLDDIRHIGGLTFVMARTTHGEIGFSLPGSVPNPPQEAMGTLVRFAKVFDLAYKRFEDLKKAEHQTRETQIELALERVRSRSMAMQNSSELKDVIQVVYQQFVGLGIPIEHTGFIMDYKDREDMNIWLADSNQFHSEITFPYFDSPHWNSYLEAKAKGENFFANLLDFETKNRFYQDLFSLIPDLPKETQDFYFAQEGLSISTVLLDNVGLYIENYTTTTFTDEENQVLLRFGKVFQQTYTRFLDLQKAEAQARESQIEAALERVRSRSLAMHKSEELEEVILVVSEQLQQLQFRFHNVSFGLDAKQVGLKFWLATPGLPKPLFINVPYLDNPGFTRPLQARNDGVNFSSDILTREENKQFLQHLLDHSEPGSLNPESINFLLDSPGFARSQCLMKNTILTIGNYNLIPYSEDENAIFKRFGNVFEQAYTRFLDLQKAEAQAHEAKIEAALEKVRSRTMGMQSSEELPEVANLLFLEVQGLGVPAWSSGFNIIAQDGKSAAGWMSSEGVLQEPFKLRLFGESSFDEMGAFIKSKDTFMVQELGGSALVEHYDHMKSFPDLKPTFSAIEAQGLSLPTYQINHLCKFSHGFLLFITYEPVPDAHDIFNRFAKVFDQTYTRFLDLQKAEAQARKAQIEAALERTRTQSMLMKHSDEIKSVSEVFQEQLLRLDISSEFSYVWLPDESTSSHQFWASWTEDQKGKTILKSKQVTYPMDKSEAYTATCLKALETPEVILEEFVPPGEIVGFFDVWKELLTGAQKLKAESFPDGIYYSEAYMRYGCFGINIRRRLSDEEKTILKRFSIEFERAYTRFLDLKKAEAQAKEARIEAALERVRSRTMGMQKAEELGEVATVLFSELNTLVDNLWTCGFVLCEKGRKEDEWWLSLDNGLIQPFSLPNVGDFAHENLYKGWEMGDAYRTVTLENEQLLDHYDWLMNIPIAKQIFEDMEGAGIPRPDWQRLHAAYFKTGYLVIITEVPCEEEEIFKRFAQVFDLTYTRFLDLTKAEAQAKEAKLELSLQRIRAQVTSMTHSDELFDIVVSMRKEFVNLGHEADYFWHMKWTPESYEMSMTSEDGERVGMIISVPKFVHDEIPRLAAWEKSGSPTIALDLNGHEAWDYIDKMNTYGKYEQADPHAPTKEDIMAIGGLTFVIARTTHGEIGFSLPGQVPNPPEESMGNLVRFASVFDLAYRRFEDLLTSEKQTRKAKIELALERVRARAMAMQEPEELIEVAQVMREEMGLLGVEELETSSIYINKDIAGKAECWYSIKDIREGTKTYAADHFDLNYKDTWVGRKMLDFYQSDETKTSILMKGENRVEWINYCAHQSPKLEGYYGTEIPERTYHLTKFSNGAIGAATPGEISTESWDLLRRAALVFSLAYSRFKDLSQAREDLKRLKKAKARAEKALKELKSAQEQLIQQEKLASLGQLTAGIAHEIKNPLNFVNNFSDLSRELIEEVFEELENVEDSDAKEEIVAILNDVKSNLAKVHEHGSRADSIVTSMLQHSRASGSKREPKAFNPLVKEFVNLSFHGMRAGKAPINVDIDLQLDPKVGDVTLISEDFSRVILNLCNNAFDAMRDKLKTGDGSRETEDGNRYLPKLTVKTSLQKDKVIFSIADNGPGIPAEIKDKILQPFFTTKKGTEGTGLGLSITHDIIKAHGGSLQVSSTVGAGTEMNIFLPID
ncbi:MAG: ATP-binding protein [Algoriphagus sp.]|uniref:ATP-binding protein n=1 Tax=Algoriphagus sp. TaxID=1872435 RepID=UPI00262AAB06|nr:ATP-binding protein [Algoriphagus sp.]MDG1277820.1 ATP-binding protein [Algoriphagus sp.]